MKDEISISFQPLPPEWGRAQTVEHRCVYVQGWTEGRLEQKEDR